MRARLLLVLALLLPRAALATCPNGLISNALGARLDESAWPVLKQSLLDRLPEQILVPESPYTLFTCGDPFEDTTVTPRNGVVDLEIGALDMAFESGEIVITGRLTVRADADLDFVICALPDADCTAKVIARNIDILLRLAPSVENCEAQFPFSEVSLTVVPAAVTVELGECGLYDNVVNATYEFLREWIVGYAVGEVEDILRTEVPAWLASYTSELFASGFEGFSMRFDVAPESIIVTEDSLNLGFLANAKPTVPVPPCLPADSRLPSEESVALPLMQSDEYLAVRAAKPFLQRVLRSAWLAGWFCFDSRAFDLDLDTAIQTIIPEGSIAFTVAELAPPAIALSPGTTSILVDLPELIAEVEIAVGDRGSTLATAELDASLGMSVGVDPITSSLVAEPRSLETGPVELTVPGDVLGFDEEAMTGFIQNLVLPLFTEELGALPITTSIFTGAPVALNLADVNTTKEYLQANFDLYPVDPNDETPPFTVITELPAMPSTREVSFYVGSVDDKTPLPYMRHQLTIDGVLDTKNYTGEHIVVGGLESGLHEIEVRALDLNGNVDISPVYLDVVVDSFAPIVTIDSSPIGVIREDRAEITFSAEDDYTKNLRYRFTAGLVQRENVPDVPFAEGEVFEGETIVLEGIPDSAIVRVTVFAKDSAGNEGKATVGFATNLTPSLGCNAAGPSSLALLLLFLRRKKRGGVARS